MLLTANWLAGAESSSELQRRDNSDSRRACLAGQQSAAASYMANYEAEWILMWPDYPAAQEPPFTIYTDKTKACRDYVWYSSENLNGNTALQVRQAHAQVDAQAL